jgi:hypothetical protein
MNSSDTEMGTVDSAVSAFSATDALTVNKNDQENHTRTAHRMNHGKHYVHHGIKVDGVFTMCMSMNTMHSVV